ncbi:type II toxin-antitoxin system VapC family toxin [Luteolibacter sp. Populi]|uniref:type II toxin-antitoxin system VapC family toxin n=1 Tax=Luteolibacter sp. Populi TaxID=3230487 RepID=UPI003467BF86
MALILDSNFVITLDRDRRRKSPGSAHAFLKSHANEHFQITFTIAGELACGRSVSAQADWEVLCRPFAVIPWSPEISWAYGEIFRHLQVNGKMIGTNDLWIAATALVHSLPVVTNNVSEFRRVPGLSVISY